MLLIRLPIHKAIRQIVLALCKGMIAFLEKAKVSSAKFQYNAKNCTTKQKFRYIGNDDNRICGTFEKISHNAQDAISTKPLRYFTETEPEHRWRSLQTRQK